MNTTHPVICPHCDHPEMDVAPGAKVGSGINYWKRTCPKCQTTLMLMIMEKDVHYEISSLSADEFREKQEKLEQLRYHESQADKIRVQLRKY